MAAQRSLLDDGRWHLQHGPIDILIGADGEAGALQDSHDAAWKRFATVLQELVEELPLLRRQVMGPCPLRGPISQRMWWACRPHRAGFITPMAAVAGAVAQELIGCYQRAGVRRAWVNNGGDIALHLARGESLRIGLYADLSRLDADQLLHGLALDGSFVISQDSPVRGVATSGWLGRSFSLGIADSVTTLARTAAEADAAATVIANAVNVDDARVLRRPACELKDDTDLGDLPVTVDVPTLEPELTALALQSGLQRARELQRAGLICSSLLVCQGMAVSTDSPRPVTLAQSPRPARLGSVFA